VLGVRDDEVGLARRCVTAAAVGGGLGLVWLITMKTASLDVALSRAELGAMGIVVFGLPAGALLAWPLLSAAGVRKAWRIVLAAPVPVLAMWHLLDVLWLNANARDGGFSVLPLLALTAGGYAAAALITAPGVRLRWRRPAVADRRT
jgi:hypothetical protein